MISDLDKAISVARTGKRIVEKAKMVMKKTEFEKFNKLMEELYVATNAALMAGYDSLDALYEEKRALSPKLDPALMGGLVDGIAGPAAGVYTAVSISEKNGDVAATRREASANARRAVASSEGAKQHVVEVYEKIMPYIEKHGELKKLHDDAVLVTKYLKPSEKKKKKFLGLF